MAESMSLLWGSGSGPCWRVMLALEEKKLQGYRHKLISFEKNEHKSQEVLEINPRGELPAFKHGDIILNQSTGACLYLESPKHKSEKKGKNMRKNCCHLGQQRSF
uniref:Glutathione S-transferase A-like n=1 Tax=Salarias fasciatus TaxID=181472 RepID=A0A672H5U0_SALFA